VPRDSAWEATAAPARSIVISRAHPKARVARPRDAHTSRPAAGILELLALSRGMGFCLSRQRERRVWLAGHASPNRAPARGMYRSPDVGRRVTLRTAFPRFAEFRRRGKVARLPRWEFLMLAPCVSALSSFDRLYPVRLALVDHQLLRMVVVSIAAAAGVCPLLMYSSYGPGHFGHAPRSLVGSIFRPPLRESVLAPVILSHNTDATPVQSAIARPPPAAVERATPPLVRIWHVSQHGCTTSPDGSHASSAGE